jgi:hypothetical protein
LRAACQASTSSNRYRGFRFPAEVIQQPVRLYHCFSLRPCACVIKARRGAKRAEVAIAHKILVAAYHMLSRGVGYHDLGEAYLDQIDQTRTAANLKRRLERLGYVVSIQPKEVVPNSVEAAA